MGTCHARMHPKSMDELPDQSADAAPGHLIHLAPSDELLVQGRQVSFQDRVSAAAFLGGAGHQGRVVRTQGRGAQTRAPAPMHLLEFAGAQKSEAAAACGARVGPAARDPDVVARHRGHVLGGEGVLRQPQRGDFAAVPRGEDVGQGLAIAENLLVLVRLDPAAPFARRQAFRRQELIDRPQADGHVNPGRLADAPLLGPHAQLVHCFLQRADMVVLGGLDLPNRPRVHELCVFLAVQRLDADPVHVILAILDATLGHHAHGAIALLNDHDINVGEVELHLGGVFDADEARTNDQDGRFRVVQLLQHLVLPLQVPPAATEESLVQSLPRAVLDPLVQKRRVPQALLAVAVTLGTHQVDAVLAAGRDQQVIILERVALVRRHLLNVDGLLVHIDTQDFAPTEVDR
mmetsp:Transcript_85014/g.259626  ORF Transcript_85014/g.259626 Transcript_85014/m.259626 type:complete len:404 (+) Transcript_85014:163-1374(+)